MDKNKSDKCTELFNKYAPLIRNLCSVKLNFNKCEIDDVVADVFMVICDKIDEVDYYENHGGWVISIFKNVIRTKYKNLSKTREKYNKVTVRMSFELNDMESFTAKTQVSDYIDEIKQILTEDEFKIIKYHYFDNLKMKEIAEIMNSTETAIKQKNYRITRRLRQHFKSEK